MVTVVPLHSGVSPPVMLAFTHARRPAALEPLSSLLNVLYLLRQCVTLRGTSDPPHQAMHYVRNGQRLGVARCVDTIWTPFSESRLTACRVELHTAIQLAPLSVLRSVACDQHFTVHVCAPAPAARVATLRHGLCACHVVSRVFRSRTKHLAKFRFRIFRRKFDFRF